jgi:hypothetical protein
MIVLIDSYQETRAEQGDQCSCLQLICRALDVARYLPWRFSAATLDIGMAAVAKISCVKLANSIIGEPGALADGPGSRLMANHSQRQLKLAALARISVVGQSHFLPFMIDKDHI